MHYLCAHARTSVRVAEQNVNNRLYSNVNVYVVLIILFTCQQRIDNAFKLLCRWLRNSKGA